MAKGADPPTGKMVPADCVSVLLMAIGNTSISKAQFDMMSALDGTRTASSFEHQFRSITQKAKDLKARVDQGEEFKPVAPSKKRGAASDFGSPATPKKQKTVIPKTPKTVTPKTPKEATPEVVVEEDPKFADEFAEGVETMFKQGEE